MNFYCDIQDNDSLIGKCINKEAPNTHIIIGKAGVGKSYKIKKRVEQDPSYCLLTAPTGIAAINLDSRTLNSALGFFNTKGLMYLYKTGKLQEKLEHISKYYKNIGIDEASMLSDKKGDILVEALAEVNENKKDKLGLILIADFLQLPPVNKNGDDEKYLFEGNAWPLISDNITKLDKIYRQDNKDFIDALSLIRQNKGHCAATKLSDLNVKFTTQLDYNFNGMTIMGTNDSINSYNERRFNDIDKPLIRVRPIRRGSQLSEWDEHIPVEQRFKKTSEIMILANDTDGWVYVNGDVGVIIDYVKATNTGQDNDYFLIKLKRNDNIIRLNRIERNNLIEHEPPQKAYTSMFMPKVDPITNQWIIGTIKYHPIILSYGTTVHKAQGLSLDKVQIDIRAKNFHYPHMIYVALSRAKNPDNLVIVGTKQDFVNKVKTDARVLKWI